MQNLVVVSHTDCAHVRGPKIWGTLGPRPIRMGAWLTHRNTLLLACYRYQLNFVALGQTVWAQVEVPKVFGTLGPNLPWDGSVAITPRNTLLLHVCYRTKFRRSRSNRLAVIMEILQKILTTRVPPF